MALSASEAAALAGSGDAVVGWRLDANERGELLRRFVPAFPNAIADHVTLVSNAAPDAPLPRETQGQIIGRANDGEGVEAMVVSIAGTTRRPDGGTYHITWSLADGRDAQASNDVIAERGWEELDAPLPVALHPSRLR